jgi:hypothetical protein
MIQLNKRHHANAIGHDPRWRKPQCGRGGVVDGSSTPDFSPLRPSSAGNGASTWRCAAIMLPSLKIRFAEFGPR